MEDLACGQEGGAFGSPQPPFLSAPVSSAGAADAIFPPSARSVADFASTCEVQGAIAG